MRNHLEEHDMLKRLKTNRKKMNTGMKGVWADLFVKH